MKDVEEIVMFLRAKRDLARERQNDPECEYCMTHFYEGEISLVDQALTFIMRKD